MIAYSLTLSTGNDSPFHRHSEAAAKTSPKDGSVRIDYNELLQHFEKVQNKHLEVRHQRAGDSMERRLGP